MTLKPGHETKVKLVVKKEAKPYKMPPIEEPYVPPKGYETIDVNGIEVDASGLYQYFKLKGIAIIETAWGVAPPGMKSKCFFLPGHLKWKLIKNGNWQILVPLKKAGSTATIKPVPQQTAGPVTKGTFAVAPVGVSYGNANAGPRVAVTDPDMIAAYSKHWQTQILMPPAVVVLADSSNPKPNGWSYATWDHFYEHWKLI